MTNSIKALKHGEEVLLSGASELFAKYANGEMFIKYEGGGWLKTELTIEEVAKIAAR